MQSYKQNSLQLTGLDLTNFRGFKSMSLGFDPRLTVFIGENGSGKTSILEATAKALQLFTLRLTRPLSDIDIKDKGFFTDFDILNGENKSEVEIKAEWTIEKEISEREIQSKIDIIQKKFQEDINLLEEDKKEQVKNSNIFALEKEKNLLENNKNALESKKQVIQGEINTLYREQNDINQKLQEIISLKNNPEKIIKTIEILKNDIKKLENDKTKFTQALLQQTEQDLIQQFQANITDTEDKIKNNHAKIAEYNEEFKNRNKKIQNEIDFNSNYQTNLNKTKTEIELLEVEILKIDKEISKIMNNLFHMENTKINYENKIERIELKKRELELEKNAEIELIQTGINILNSNEHIWQIINERNLQESKNYSEMAEIITIARTLADDLIADRDSVTLPIITYYPCGSIAFAPSEPDKKRYPYRIFEAYENALNGNPFTFRSSFDFLQRQYNRKLQNSNPIFESVAQVLYTFLTDEKTDTPFHNLYFSYENDNVPEGEMLIQQGEQTLNVLQLSAGQKIVFALVIDIARRLAIANPKSNDPMKEGTGIVLIDEIELHLHPRWQQTIITRLLSIFPKVQFVVTTHSPQLLGNLEHGRVYIVQNHEAQQLNFNTYGKDMNRILELVMGSTERNQDILDKFDTYFALIEANKLDEAQIIRTELEAQIGTEEPLFRRADGIIKRKQLIGR